ncbi:unnamed protein product [Rodentolepis nana]|uniref:Tyrosine-protein phosphatase domain-containing protein n=1 Tax=Rodentolepis nana TaxID=102285 RepID=A0A3P7V3K5_RODNA|nr:unnamed protein product [Rodentolepis nana]
MGLIVSLVVVCVILVILLILLIVFWKRIKRICNKPDVDESTNVIDPNTNGVKSEDPITPNNMIEDFVIKDFVINYVESEEPITSNNVLYPPVAFGNFKNHVESLKAEGQMSKLFQYLKDLATEQERRLQLSVNAANEMKSRNRYSDILPYDQSMVILGHKWPLPLTDPKPNVISGLLSAAYVNASFVRGPLFTPTGCAVPATYSQSPDYITTQGPLENTVADFLTMIYQQRVPHIMMLCRNVEDERDKCARYWPSEPERGGVETFTSEHHTVTVTFLEIELLESGVRRVISICPHDEKDAIVNNQSIRLNTLFVLLTSDCST